MTAASSNQANVCASGKRNGRVPRTPERRSCQRPVYVTLVKCHVQTAARLISVSRFHALLMEAGITRKAVSAACAYMFLWSHPLPLDKAEKKGQIFTSIFGLLLCENVHAQKDRHNDERISCGSGGWQKAPEKQETAPTSLNGLGSLA